MASVGGHKSDIVDPVGVNSDDFGGWNSCLAKEGDLLGGFLGFRLGVPGLCWLKLICFQAEGGGPWSSPLPG